MTAVPLLLLALCLVGLAAAGGFVPATAARAATGPRIPADTTCGRAFFGAATGADGHVYAVGGSSDPCGAKYLDLTQAYNPQTNSWTDLAAMPTPRDLLAVTAGSDARIYAIGGQSATSETLTTVEAYTPATNSWATLAPMPTARHSLAAVTGPGGLIYAYGGYISAGQAVNTVEVYDPQANSWKAVAPMLSARDSLAGTVSHGRIFALGGQYGTGDVASVEAYTPASNTWQAVAPMAQTHGKFAAATGLDGRVYAISEDPYYTTPTSTQGSVEVYDPIANSWSDTTPLASPRWALAAATLSDGRILAIGGETSDYYCAQPSTVIEAYDPANRYWSPMASLPGTPQAATPGPVCRVGGVTPVPTNTPRPPATPVPTATNTPLPTPAPSPTPTATPVPVSSPGPNRSVGFPWVVLIALLVALAALDVGVVLLVGRRGLRAPDAPPAPAGMADVPPPPGGPSAPNAPDAPTQPGE
ncbi:MAG TPA: kelch repeat-containing protein [Ktedonobacterales bacterium]